MRKDDSPSDGDWGLIAPVFGATLTHRRRSKRAYIYFLLFYGIHLLITPQSDYQVGILHEGNEC